MLSGEGNKFRIQSHGATQCLVCLFCKCNQPLSYLWNCPLALRLRVTPLIAKLKSMKYKLILSSIAFITLSISSLAQDSIIKKDGSELNVKITEVTESELKYQKPGLSVAFSINLNEVLLVTFENGERMTFDNVKEANVSEATSTITAGTRIPLVMSETISSDEKGGRKVSTGELIALTVQMDVTDIDGNIVVKQGTLVNATVTKSEKRKAAGTKGKLGFNVGFVKAADGQSIPVDLNYDSEGKSRTGAVVAGAVLVAAPLLLVKGKAAVIEAGTIFNALVVGDKKIKLE